MLSTDLSWTDLRFMLDGGATTLALTFWAMVLGTTAGVALGVLRAAWPRASAPLAWLLDVFRSVPLLIQFVLANAIKSILALDLSAFAVGCAVLGIYCAAYCTEVVRAGLLAVPPALTRAARSLGMSRWQALCGVVAPIAARVAFPSWVNLSLGVMKDTSLVLWIGIVELLRASQVVVTRLQEPLFVLAVAGLLYYLMSLGVTRAAQTVEKRWKSHD